MRMDQFASDHRGKAFSVNICGVVRAMAPNSRYWLAVLVGCGVLGSQAVRLNALQPPTAEQLQRYRADGTLERRLADAQRFGNHRSDPRLVWRLHENLRAARARALGLTPAQDDRFGTYAPPPAWQGGLPTRGNPKVLVLMVDFPDYAHTPNQTPSDVESKFFGAGNPSEAPYESLRNYYQRSSYNALNIQGNVLGWYRAQHNRSYYEGLGDGPGQEVLMSEAITHFDSLGHDFAQYDNDGDGTVDGLFLKWTGPIGEWASFWWAYRWTWHSTSFTVDGKRLGQYVWSWIASPPGGNYSPHVDIHETGHLLGLPDLYDYNGSVGPDGGVGGLDIMDANWGDHNCFSKFLLEWLTPATVVSGSQVLTLNPSGTSQDCVLIMPGVTAGDLFSEFFMAQYRRRSAGNDPSNYPTDGLVIWHIDARLNPSGYNYLYDNSYTEHKLVRLMEADGLEQIEQNGWADADDFYRPPAALTPRTVPNSKAYSGADTFVRVDGLGAPGGSMTARFSVSPYHNITRDTWHESIQAAIDEAVHGDEIVLSPGTHTGPGNRDVDFLGKAITVRGPDPADPAVVAATVIDCQGSAAQPHRGFKFVSGEGPGSVLAGLTIKNGFGPQEEGVHAAGAILCRASNPTIRDCVISGNHSDFWAGGIGLFDSPASGGRATITRCTFAGNSCGDVGAGVYMRYITATISNCRFLGNTAAAGAGVFCIGSGTDGSTTIRNCLFDANHATIRGGAVRNSTGSALSINNCTVTNNSAGSEGGGLHTNSSLGAEVTNCIFWANSDAGGADESAQMHIASGTVEVNYCDVQGWTGNLGGTGNFGADPLLEDIDGPDNDPATWLDNDLHLALESPCVNGGDPGGNYTGQTDIDGEPRVQQSRVDIGADESTYANYCRTSTPVWQNVTIAPQNGMFSVRYDATPHGSNIDGITALSAAPGTGYSDFAILVRFNVNGTIDARNGGVYAASTSIPYMPGTVYSFRLLIDVPNRLYSVYVAPEGGSELTVGTGYAFRTEQNGVTSLANWGLVSSVGSHTVCGFRIGPGVHNITQDLWYSTIQEAIDAAAAGDEIVLNPGTFTGPGNRDVNFHGKAITVRSTDPSDSSVVALTVMDCEQSGSGFVFNNEEGSDSVIEGLTIENALYGVECGECWPWGTWTWPTIRNCTIRGSLWNGISVCQGAPAVENCVLTGCGSDGIEVLEGGVVIAGSKIIGNGRDGVNVFHNSDVELTSSLIGWNGGLGVSAVDLHNHWWPSSWSNCTVVGNAHGGIRIAGSAAEIKDCILWGNGGSQLILAEGEESPADTLVEVSYSNIEGGQAGASVSGEQVTLDWGEGIIENDPMFVDPDGPDDNPATWADNDYHLQSNSPCLDAGDPNLDCLGSDIDGEQRCQGCGIDIGADETSYSRPSVPVDFDHNCRVNQADWLHFESCVTGPGIGPPKAGCNTADLDGDTDVDQSDFGIFQRCYSGEALANPNCNG